MGNYVDANSTLVEVLSKESVYEVRYERVMEEGKKTSQRILIGEMTTVNDGVVWDRQFILDATYGFATAKNANAFLNGLITMNDLRWKTSIRVEDDPHYVITL